MKTVCLNAARCSLAAWVGAAAIFVVTAVHEVQSTEFDSRVKSQLALLRFPTYYHFGFALVPAAAVCGALAVGHPVMNRRRAICFFGLMAGVIILMLVDYYTIYSPLRAMLQAEGTGSARPTGFQSYHRASKYINMFDVGLCLVAMLILCLPESKPQT